MCEIRKRKGGKDEGGGGRRRLENHFCYNNITLNPSPTIVSKHWKWGPLFPCACFRMQYSKRNVFHYLCVGSFLGSTSYACTNSYNDCTAAVYSCTSCIIIFFLWIRLREKGIILWARCFKILSAKSVGSILRCALLRRVLAKSPPNNRSKLSLACAQFIVWPLTFVGDKGRAINMRRLLNFGSVAA